MSLIPRWQDLTPVPVWHNNLILSGAAFDNVDDLPCTRFQSGDMPQVCSVWKAPWISRLRFLFTGEIHLIAFGATHPPVSMVIGEYFQKEGPRGQQ